MSNKKQKRGYQKLIFLILLLFMIIRIPFFSLKHPQLFVSQASHFTRSISNKRSNKRSNKHKHYILDALINMSTSSTNVSGFSKGRKRCAAGNYSDKYPCPTVLLSEHPIFLLRQLLLLLKLQPTFLQMKVERLQFGVRHSTNNWKRIYMSMAVMYELSMNNNMNMLTTCLALLMP